MVFRRRFFRKFARRRFRRTFRRRRPSMKRRRSSMKRPSRLRMGLFQKDQAFAKLRFNFSFTFSTVQAAGTAAQGFTFRGNSLTPGFTAVGSGSIAAAPVRTVAVGNATMALMYNTFKCFGSKMKLTLIQNVGSANENVVWMTILPTNSQQTAGNILVQDIIGSFPYTKKRLITLSSNFTSKPITCNHYMSTRKIEGVSKAEFESSDFRATMGANPTKTWLWNVIFNNFNSANIDDNIFFVHMEVTYYCRFYGKIQNASTQ